MSNYETAEWRERRSQEWVRGRPTAEIRNIAHAMRIMQAFNTEEENERLRVAQDELKQRAADKRKAQMRKRPLCIRPTTYHGQAGFLIYGGRGWYGIFGASIFCHTRSEAERIRDAIKAGEPWTFDSQKASE